jgi:HTH-type transcriptional regulator/antitoxin HigA
MLHSFMADHHMKARDLADLLEMSKRYVSDILHYKKGLSKEVIRKLAERFKVSQEAFNRPYKLKSAANAIS